MSIALGRAGLKTIYIVRILMEQTDEDHYLNAAQIGELLEREYDLKLDRHTIYAEMKKLEDADLDIMKRDGRNGGYYIGSRQFEMPELKLMVDAVQSSRFFTKKKTEELIRKLETLCSKNQAKQLSSQVVVYNRPKAVNETIYYNVDKLHSAIYHNRKITFQYADWTARKETILRHDGAIYEVSPFHLVWDDENYYLIAYDENAGKIKHYRVDKMRSIDVTKLERIKLPEEKKIDLATFSKKTFGMFGGRDVKVTLRCKNHLAGVLIDRFGTDIWMTPSGEDHFTAQVTVTVSKQFFGWVTAIGKDMKIQAPLDVKDEYRQYLLEIFQDLDTES